MRGSPILRAVLVFIALLSLAPVLWRLTQADARTVQQPAAQKPVKNAKVEARLTFSTPAKRAVIQHLGRDVWSKASPSLEEGFAQNGERILITAGVPIGIPGTTNMVRIAYVGDQSGRKG